MRFIINLWSSQLNICISSIFTFKTMCFPFTHNGFISYVYLTCTLDLQRWACFGSMVLLDAVFYSCYVSAGDDRYGVGDWTSMKPPVSLLSLSQTKLSMWIYNRSVKSQQYASNCHLTPSSALWEDKQHSNLQDQHLLRQECAEYGPHLTYLCCTSQIIISRLWAVETMQ